jgi:hypothetical protein
MTYARSTIAADNPVYATFTPIEQSSISGMFVRCTAHILVFKTSLTYRQLTASGRFLHLFNDGKKNESRLELLCNGQF